LARVILLQGKGLKREAGKNRRGTRHCIREPVRMPSLESFPGRRGLAMNLSQETCSRQAANAAYGKLGGDAVLFASDADTS
jgi:hypothetical protein